MNKATLSKAILDIINRTSIIRKSKVLFFRLKYLTSIIITIMLNIPFENRKGNTTKTPFLGFHRPTPANQFSEYLTV